MTPRAYCGDACRALRRRRVHEGDSFPFAQHRHHFTRENGPELLARFQRQDRQHFARIGACLGCGTTAAERASELVNTSGAIAPGGYR